MRLGGMEKLAKLTLIALISTFFSIIGPIVQQNTASANPGGISSTPLVWLDATDIDSNTATANPAESSTVTTWSDKSSNGNNATVLSGKNAPTYSGTSGINGGPALRFTRVTDTVGAVLNVSGVDIRASQRPKVTIFAVYRAINPVNGQLYGVWGQDNGAWDRFAICCGFGGVDTGVVGLPANGPNPAGFAVGGAGTGTRLLTVVYDGNVSGSSNTGPTDGSSIWFEGGRVHRFTDRTDPTAAETTFRIGWDGDGSAFNGWISEIIVFGSALSDDDIVTVSNYLGGKYDLTIAPTPVTLAATSIDSTTATLNGTVNAHRDTTTSITIRYSTDSSTVTNNTATSPTVSPSQVSGNTDVAVSAVITGLSPGTTYWFRVRATNSRGTNAGALQSFTTTSNSVVTSCAGAGALTNGSFEDGSTGWRTTALDGSIEIWPDVNNSPALIESRTSTTQITAPANAYSYQGSKIAEIAANNAGDGTSSRQGLYQDVNTINGSRIFWSYWHKHRAGADTNGNADQVARFRAANTPAAGTRPSGTNWTSAEQADPFNGNTVLTNVSHTVTLNSAWTQSSGTFVANASSTRFLFSNETSPAAGYGNLIDDVRFTTFTACPINVRIVAGRSSSFTVRSNEQNVATFQFYGPQATTINNLSSISSGLTASVSNNANTNSVFSLSASTVGTYTAVYQIAHTLSNQTYTSSAQLTVEVVPEVTGRFPSVMPIHPALTSKSLSGVRLAAATSAYICVDQVNSSGTVISPATISASNSSLVSGVSLISSSPLTDSGTVTSLTSQMERIIISANSGPLSRGGSKYIRVRAASIDNTDGVARSCENGITVIIELRVTNATQLNRKNLPLGNGRQN